MKMDFFLLCAQDTDTLIPKKSSRPFRMVLEQLHLELKDAYSNLYLYKYMIWVSVATGVYFQVNVTFPRKRLSN